jgi:hypothetical protein
VFHSRKIIKGGLSMTRHPSDLAELCNFFLATPDPQERASQFACNQRVRTCLLGHCIKRVLDGLVPASVEALRDATLLILRERLLDANDEMAQEFIRDTDELKRFPVGLSDLLATSVQMACNLLTRVHPVPQIGAPAAGTDADEPRESCPIPAGC